MHLRANKSAFAGLLAAAGLLSLAGCEDSVRQAVRVDPPEIAAPQHHPVQALAQLPIGRRAGDVAVLDVTAPDGIERLVAASQAAFDAGEKDYKAGRLAKAREEFDAAVDALLASGYDLESDSRLSALYHQIIESVNADEMAAFRAGDGFTEQKPASAPLDELAAMDLPESEKLDPALRGNAEGEVKNIAHDLPLAVNDYVLAFLNFFQTPRGRAIVETGLTRAGRYRSMIQRVLREEGLPEDLIFMAQAESAFQPQAVSKAGARGLWQFMSWDGRQYGLQKSWWVDDRQDPEKETRAAAQHLRDLYDQFGDWYLVMAAYDSGPAGVQRAIERTGYADFWELYKRNVLPKETKNYVPIILALTLISKDPARYGVHVDPEPPVQADTVKPGHPIDLRLVAETIDSDLDTLRALNPQLLRLVTPTDPEFVLRLPEGTAERFYAEIAAIPPEKWVSWRRHRVEEGETLSAIARRYHVTSAVIADANGIAAHAPLEVGSKLIIPVSARSEPAFGKLIRYRARRGDTVESIADEFDVTVAELRRWNGLRGNRVARGARLKIYPGGMAAPPQTKSSGRTQPAANSKSAATQATIGPRENAVVHHVKAGETLWSIARAYQTTVEALRAGNRFLFSRPLQVGDTLTILSAR